MIRIILASLVVVLFLLIGILVLPIEWLIGRISPRARDITSLRLVQWAFSLILWIAGTKVTLIGKENLPKDHAVLYIGNHRSIFDILLTYVRCPDLTGYISKKELKKAPLLNIWMERLYCLFLDRHDIKAGLKTILTAIDNVKHGISIFVFPEGTRNKNKSELDLLDFHEGSFKIAQKANCPIIPVSLNGTAAIFEDQFPKVRRTHVIIEYGKEIHLNELSDNDRKFIGTYVRNIMQETLQRNQSLL